VRQGLTLVELLVALAVLGLATSLMVGSIVGLFRIQGRASLEAQAAGVAKAYLERLPLEASYDRTNRTLTLPTLNSGGFTARTRVAERLAGGAQTFTVCTPGSPCPVSCTLNGSPVACPLVAVELTLTKGSRTFTFYREWTP
jgi:prepilin-type N-terminal cleavage/methylation domain-containing protein